jgi:hypothetical protein
MTPDDRELVEAAIELLRYFLENEDEFTPEVRAACSAIFKSAHGHPPGEGWRVELAKLLREQAQRREQVRIGADATWPKEGTDASQRRPYRTAIRPCRLIAPSRSLRWTTQRTASAPPAIRKSTR